MQTSNKYTMMRPLQFLIFMLSFSFMAYSQYYPKNMHFDASTHILSTHLENDSDFYNIDLIESVNMDFYAIDFWALMHENYGTENYVLASLTYKGEVYDSVGVQFKGQTSYRKPAQQNSEKLSFDVKTDYVIDGQDINGYSTFNFNNSYQDHTFMREVLYTHLAAKNIPAARANYIELSLNGEYWGLYPNVQQVNNDFVGEWFMDNDGIRWRADVPLGVSNPPGNPVGPNWGDGTAALNYHGLDASEYQQYYTLKSSKLEDPWNYLIDVCRVLENIEGPDYPDTLKKYLNIDATLWFLATEILFSDDDSYIYKGKMDYSLYYDQQTALMNLLEIDGNSAMVLRNADWGLFYHANDENYPLLNRLLNIPELRQRYLAHVRTIIKDCFTEESLDWVDSQKTVLAPFIQSDPKSPTTYSQFNTEVSRLKKFITDRKIFIEGHPEYQVLSPIITNTSFSTEGVEWQIPTLNDEVSIKTSVSHPAGIDQVKLYYSTNLSGNFYVVEMEKTDDFYESTLMNFKAGENIRFYIEAIADNTSKTRAYFPEGAEHEVLHFKVKQETLEDPVVVINEFMASNTATVADQDGDFDDWIELYNLSDNLVDLSGYYLSDKEDNITKWTIPAGTEIGAYDYLIIWADENGSQEGLHANFKLSKSGESISLSNPEEILVDYVDFGEQEEDKSSARIPNGTGDFVIQEATFGENNENALSVFNPGDENAIIIFPNPASSYLQLLVNDSFSTIDKISIFDSFGNIIYNISGVSKAKIDINDWHPGVYYVRFNEQISKLIVY